jgi:hypothetical protein
LRIATTLLDAALAAKWPADDLSKTWQAKHLLQAAYNECSIILPGVLRDRRKMPKDALPRWAGAELLRQVGSLPGRQCVVATQLSNILGVDPVISSFQVLPSEDARRLTAALYSDTKAALDALHAPECMVWAAADQSLLGRWIVAFAQQAAECPRPRTVHLLVTHGGLPRVLLGRTALRSAAAPLPTRPQSGVCSTVRLPPGPSAADRAWAWPGPEGVDPPCGHRFLSTDGTSAPAGPEACGVALATGLFRGLPCGLPDGGHYGCQGGHA